MRWAATSLAWLASSLALASAAHGQPPAAAPDLAHPQGTNAGIFAFTARCAGCHDTGKNGASDRYTLNRHTPEEVLASITIGKMAPYAEALSEYEKRVVAVYVGGRPLGAAALAGTVRSGIAERTSPVIRCRREMPSTTSG
jgi:mono/diheme cytochrome c family protein